MSIDLEAIRARADTATPGPWKIGRQSPSGAQNVGTLHGILTAQTTSKENAAFIAHAREDIPALLAEVERQAAEIETLRSELYPEKEIEEQRAKRWEAEKRLLQKTREQLAAVTAERDAAVKAVAKMAEYIVTLGGVDYHLCDDIPRKHHLKYQPKDDGDYDNEPCIECVKAYFMSGAGKERNGENG